MQVKVCYWHLPFNEWQMSIQLTQTYLNEAPYFATSFVIWSSIGSTSAVLDFFLGLWSSYSSPTPVEFEFCLGTIISCLSLKCFRIPSQFLLSISPQVLHLDFLVAWFMSKYSSYLELFVLGISEIKKRILRKLLLVLCILQCKVCGAKDFFYTILTNSWVWGLRKIRRPAICKFKKHK